MISPEASIGSGGRGEAGGMLVYTGSLLLVKPGEFGRVTFRLYIPFMNEVIELDISKTHMEIS
jgi:hypothetical protein